MSTWIKTYTGKRFYPRSPRGKDVDIRDIAHSLSMQCRFTGHTREFYSVAEHSVRVAWYLDDHPLKLHGLLHDASEAYFGDIAEPIKRTLKGIEVQEFRILRAVYRGLGLPIFTVEEWDEVRYADAVLCATEGRDLMGGTQGWRPLPEPLPSTIGPMSQREAKEAFLELYSLYTRQAQSDL